jgi:CelD/BcsL family acetyltransferase involved in cellulose biosynthesis
MTPAAANRVWTSETAERPAAHPAIRVETVSSYHAFLNLEPVWNQLVEASGIDHPFLEHVWVRTWWECFGAGSRMHVLVLKERDEVIAIAPLISTRVRMFGIPVRRLGFFYNEHVPRADFLIARRPEDAYRAIWNHLRCTSGSWDLLQLCQLRQGAGTFEEILRLASEDGLPTSVWMSGASPLVDLDTSWRQYHDGLAAKHRSNLRNRFKRLNQTGLVTIETVAAPESLSGALDAGVQIEESSWKREAGTAISCDANVRKFYETFARRAAERTWLRLNFLRAGEQRVAFDYSLAYRDQIFLLKLGYDPAFSAYSPSNLLLSMALENAFEQGLKTYDFLGENAEWKSCWTKASRSNYWLSVFSRSFKGRSLHFLKSRVIPWVKSARQRPRKEAAI